MREFTIQDRITLHAKLAAGAMHVAAEPRETAAVEVLPYDGSAASREAAERAIVELRGSTLHVESPEGGWRLWRAGQLRGDVPLPPGNPRVIRRASGHAPLRGRVRRGTVDTPHSGV